MKPHRLMPVASSQLKSFADKKGAGTSPAPACEHLLVVL